MVGRRPMNEPKLVNIPKDFELLVNPDQCRVYPSFENKCQVLVRVTDISNREIHVKINLYVPEDIVVMINEVTGIREDYNEWVSLKPGGVHNLYLFLRSEKGKSSIENLKVTVSQGSKYLTKSVTLFIMD